MANNSSVRGLSKFADALWTFRDVERNLPIQVAHIFVYVATHDGCLQETMPEALGMSNASVSRGLDWLGPVHRSGKPGLKLIRKERDPEYYKRFKIFLTPKGQAFADLINDTLED